MILTPLPSELVNILGLKPNGLACLSKYFGVYAGDGLLVIEVLRCLSFSLRNSFDVNNS